VRENESEEETMPVRTMQPIEGDTDDVESWDVHHWQNLNPVIPEGLIQMAMGTPAAVYHGGLLHASVRYFDPLRQRPGLPERVAALVESIAPEGIDLVLVNTDPLQSREVLVQAGAFGEHVLRGATLRDASAGEQHVPVAGRHLSVVLGPSAQARLRLEVERFAAQPSYDYPPFA
jgi:hypothetical protein